MMMASITNLKFKTAFEVAEERALEFVGSGKVDEWVKMIAQDKITKQQKSELKARLMLLKLFGFDIEKRLKNKLRQGTF